MFHPQSTILVSGGDDKRVNFFDYTKSTVKKAYKCIGVSQTFCIFVRKTVACVICSWLHVLFSVRIVYLEQYFIFLYLWFQADCSIKIDWT